MPLAIFVNERINKDMDYLNDSDEDGSHTSIPENQKQQVISAQWFEKNVNDKLE